MFVCRLYQLLASLDVGIRFIRTYMYDLIQALKYVRMMAAACSVVTGAGAGTGAAALGFPDESDEPHPESVRAKTRGGATTATGFSWISRCASLGKKETASIKESPTGSVLLIAEQGMNARKWETKDCHGIKKTRPVIMVLPFTRAIGIRDTTAIPVTEFIADRELAKIELAPLKPTTYKVKRFGSIH